MIVVSTDFGANGPYVGQIKAMLYRCAPEATVIDLFSDLPIFNPQAAAYLLAATTDEFPSGTVFLCVVDPGVGSTRKPLIMCADQRWYVGPDNGLFAIIARRSKIVEQWEILWQPETLSSSFHGRDLFAPVAAGLAQGKSFEGKKMELPQCNYKEWPDDLFEIVYLDHYGNAITGIRSTQLSRDAIVMVCSKKLTHARTFSDVSKGEHFWYENANGLVEIAVNKGSAATSLNLSIGTPVTIK